MLLASAIRIASVTALVAATIVLPTAGSAQARADAAVSVDTAADLSTAFSGAVENTVITLGSSFPDTLPSTITLSNAAGVAVEVDGGGRTLFAPPSGNHFILQGSGSGSVAVTNLSLMPAPGAGNGGLSASLGDTASATLSGLTISNMGSTALNVGGSGSGTLLIEDVTLSGNTAASAAAFSFGRNNAAAQSTLNRVSMIENKSTGGYGYSGGAMRVGAGSSGNLKIQNSLFRDNAFVDGGTLPRGGAIAMHNANVLLTLENSLFEGNSTSSTSTAANADGGAVSVFNSNSNLSGSLVVSNSSFIANEAQDDGAAIFIEGQSASATSPFPSTLTVRNSTFADNVSGDAGGWDSGGAIQVSLRVEVSIDNNSFFGNTKASGRSGVDFGVHGGFASSAYQTPIGTLTNNIFTRSNSVNGVSANLTCGGGSGCGPTAANQDAFMTGVFGSLTPEPAANNSAVVAGDSREPATNSVVPTLAIVPPLTPTTLTASRVVTEPTGLTADERGVAYRTVGPQDAGSFTMDYVHFNAAANGGSWSGLTPSLPGAQGSFVSNATASAGWFEVANPGAPVPVPNTNPTPPAGTTFVGWFDSQTGGELVEDLVASGQTIYAQFAASTHVVTFDPENGDALTEVTVDDGDVVTKPVDPVREGHTFTGWLLGGVEYDFAAVVTEDITLVAGWEETVVVSPTLPAKPNLPAQPPLAETGSDSLMPYLAGGLVLAVAGALVIHSQRNSKKKSRA